MVIFTCYLINHTTGGIGVSGMALLSAREHAWNADNRVCMRGYVASVGEHELRARQVSSVTSEDDGFAGYGLSL